MEKFIVSARKYRPQIFDTVVGQSHITTTLKNAIKQQQLAHAFLFCGPRGVGKTTCARILAKTINCEKPTKEGEACDKCQSCSSFNDGASMNYFELDAASNNSVDNIRDLVDQVRFVPQTGRYKVYVIDEVHMLSTAAFNAFLKTLEEPPSYAIFILATTEKHKILPTILSRCQIFDFKRITTNDTVQHLDEICTKEDIKAEKAALQLIAQKSEGCMRDSLSILDKIVSFTNGEVNYTNTLEHLNILDADYYFKLLDNMLEQDLSSTLLLYDDINRKGFEGDQVLNGFAEFIRNLLVCKDEKAAVLLEAVESFKEKYISVAKTTPAPLLISALNILSEAELHFKGARNKRLHVELILIKLCYLQQALQLITEGSSLSKKKLIEGAQAFRISPIKLYTSNKSSENSKKQPTNTSSIIAKTDNLTSEARLIIDTPVIKETQQIANPVILNTPLPQVKGSVNKLSALNKIRQQFQNASSAGEAVADTPLQQEDLHTAWNHFIMKLKEAKNPAAQPFSLATLRIKDENTFEAVTANNIEQKFIEQERNSLFVFLKDKLQNRQLQFSVLVEESLTDRPAIEPTLTSKEQFLKMSEQYPLIKELKERLKLDLDY
jgi:DNA polymerase III subunit gamma/tau